MKYLTIAVLAGLLGGCAEVASLLVSSAVTSAAISAVPLSEPAPSPRVVSDAPDRIAVEYRTEDTESERDAALRLIADHCAGPYTEIRTEVRGNRSIVEAQCGKAAGSITSHRQQMP